VSVVALYRKESFKIICLSKAVFEKFINAFVAAMFISYRKS
jgi:hypothetical protein